MDVPKKLFLHLRLSLKAKLQYRQRFSAFKILQCLFWGYYRLHLGFQLLWVSLIKLFDWMLSFYTGVNLEIKVLLWGFFLRFSEHFVAKTSETLSAIRAIILDFNFVQWFAAVVGVIALNKQLLKSAGLCLTSPCLFRSLFVLACLFCPCVVFVRVLSVAVFRFVTPIKAVRQLAPVQFHASLAHWDSWPVSPEQ